MTTLQDKKTGKFIKGHKGPGRPIGSLGKSADARKRILASAPEIVKVMLEKAKAGDNQMIQLAMTVISPSFRAELAPVQIPGASEAIAAGRFEDALALISQASLDGTISPDAAKQLTEQLKSAEEAKRLSFLQDQLLQLREKVVNGRVLDQQPTRMISNG